MKEKKKGCLQASVLVSFLCTLWPPSYLSGFSSTDDPGGLG